MVMPNSEERTGGKLVLLYFFSYLDWAQAMKATQRKPLGLPQNRRKEAIANIFLKEDKARQAYSFLSWIISGGTGIQEHLWLSRIEGYSGMEFEGSCKGSGLELWGSQQPKREMTSLQTSLNTTLNPLHCKCFLGSLRLLPTKDSSLTAPSLSESVFCLCVHTKEREREIERDSCNIQSLSWTL